MDVGLIAATGISSSALTMSAFYALTNWRLKKLEDDSLKNTDTRERLIRIETMITEMYKSKV